MSSVNIHIKNVEYDYVKIVVRDSFTGAVLGTKDIKKNHLENLYRKLWLG